MQTVLFFTTFIILIGMYWLPLVRLVISEQNVCHGYRRELQEELGIVLPKDAFELLCVFLDEWLVKEIANCIF